MACRSAPTATAPPPPATRRTACAYSQNYLLYDHPLAHNDQPIDPGTNVDVPDWSGDAANIRWRHLNNTAANFLFADGHVERTASLTERAAI